MAGEQENRTNDELGQKLEAMLSDPESLQKLAGMASALASSGMLSGLMGGKRTEDAQTAEPADNGVSGLPAVSGADSRSAGGALGAVSSRHAALLRALKPYLGQEKQAKIDQMMRLLQLAELADTVLRAK